MPQWDCCSAQVLTHASWDGPPGSALRGCSSAVGHRGPGGSVQGWGRPTQCLSSLERGLGQPRWPPRAQGCIATSPAEVRGGPCGGLPEACPHPGPRLGLKALSCLAPGGAGGQQQYLVKTGLLFCQEGLGGRSPWGAWGPTAPRAGGKCGQIAGPWALLGRHLEVGLG